MDAPLSEQVILTLCSTLDKAVAALARLTENGADARPLPPPPPGVVSYDDWDPTDADLPPGAAMQLHDNDAPLMPAPNPFGIPGLSWPPAPDTVVS